MCVYIHMCMYVVMCACVHLYVNECQKIIELIVGSIYKVWGPKFRWYTKKWSVQCCPFLMHLYYDDTYIMTCYYNEYELPALRAYSSVTCHKNGAFNVRG